MGFKDYFRKRGKSKKGFTLVEMVVTVAILAIVSTVTVQALFAVRDTFRNSSKITTNQYTTTQMERFIRNEFQVASKVDITGTLPTSGTTKKYDEYMMYDATNKKVVFKKVTTDGGAYEDYLSLDGVKTVNISIFPMAKVTGTPEGDDRYKLTYDIDTEEYQYKGGIVMGNVTYGDAEGIAANLTNKDGKTITWKDGSSDNGLYITFHSETMTTTPP